MSCFTFYKKIFPQSLPYFQSNDFQFLFSWLNLITYLNNSIVANKIINEKRESSDKQHISIIVDEFHLYIDENNNEVIKNFGQLARRCRKYNTNLILSSQCISDFLGNASVLRHATAIFNNCQYTMVGMLKEDDLKAYLELFKNNPLTDTQIDFLLGAKRGEFLLSIDNKTRIGIKIEATATERRMMGEEEWKAKKNCVMSWLNFLNNI